MTEQHGIHTQSRTNSYPLHHNFSSHYSTGIEVGVRSSRKSTKRCAHYFHFREYDRSSLADGGVSGWGNPKLELRRQYSLLLSVMDKWKGRVNGSNGKCLFTAVSILFCVTQHFWKKCKNTQSGKWCLSQVVFFKLKGSIKKPWSNLFSAGC